jgi:hypothetical protein
LGIIFVWVDWHAGMPTWWTALEGPPIAAFGILLFWLCKDGP